MSAYRDEADALDREILNLIGRWRVSGASDFDFNDLALRIFAHQLRFNEPYARYAAALGVGERALPSRWEDIPPVPAGAFKEAPLSTFEPAAAELTFETSGTTTGTGGVHSMESAALYDASLLAGFERAMLSDAAQPLRYLLLLPSPAQQPRSSLSHMMDCVAREFGDGSTQWYVRDGELETGALVNDLRHAAERGAPVCVAGTAFAFVNLLDSVAPAHHIVKLPPGSRVMETGGFKGRSRIVERTELYAALETAFGLPGERIVAEYGMTELSSQYYDRTSGEPRMKSAPPWLRSYAVDGTGRRVGSGIVGALVHVDLANRSSCVAVQTEDLGAVFPSGDLVLLGRDAGAGLRGCSLDAESLRAIR